MEVFAGHLQPIHHPWIPAPYRGTGHAFDRGNDELGGDSTGTTHFRTNDEWRGSLAHSKTA